MTIFSISQTFLASINNLGGLGAALSANTAALQALTPAIQQLGSAGIANNAFLRESDNLHIAVALEFFAGEQEPARPSGGRGA